MVESRSHAQDHPNEVAVRNRRAGRVGIVASKPKPLHETVIEKVFTDIVLPSRWFWYVVLAIVAVGALLFVGAIVLAGLSFVWLAASSN